MPGWPPRREAPTSNSDTNLLFYVMAIRFPARSYRDRYYGRMVNANTYVSVAYLYWVIYIRHMLSSSLSVFVLVTAWP
jgi:hypothetical protein